MSIIAFVGLGNMGGGMAANLVKAGHIVHAFDLSEEALARAEEAGCRPYASIGEAVAGVDAVVTMLPNGAIVRDVYTSGLFGAAPAGALLIDSSTIDVATARAVTDKALALGYAMVDAPVSGGIGAAEAGTLTFMVGGREGDYERAQPLLAAMGRTVVHTGPSGTGQAAKICNNMILGATMVATCEAFALAGKLGLDPATFYAVSSQSSGQSWSMTSYCPLPGVGPATPADNGYQGGFATALMLKDLKLAVEAAQQAGASVPMGQAAEALFQMHANAGQGGRDFSSIIEMLG